MIQLSAIKISIFSEETLSHIWPLPSMVVANQNMLQLLYDLAVTQPSPLPPHLQDVLAGGILEEDDCWFLAACRGGPKYTIERFGHRTGLECFVNSVHVDGKATVDPTTLQKQALTYAGALRQMLEPHGAFKIILGFSY